MKSLSLPSHELHTPIVTATEVNSGLVRSKKLAWLKPNLNAVWPLLAITLVALISRLVTAPNFIETREGIFYVRGVVRYSVAELRPYWPGYPVYMWLGKLFNLVIANPTQALHVLAVVASTLSLWPIIRLAAEWRSALGGTPAQGRLTGWTAGALWMVVPLSWLNGSEIFGDPLAVLLGLLMLWLSWRALHSANPTGWLLVTALTSGLMLGVRLAYVPLLLVLAYVTWRQRRYPLKWRNHNLPVLPLLVALTLLVAIGLWLGWQLALEGWKFIQVGTSQLQGHYTEWGNSVVSDPNILTRPLRLLETYLVYGLGGWWPGTPLLRLPVTGLILGLAANGIRRLARHEAGKLALLWTGSYLVCTLVNYDVDLARYSFPLVAITCIAAGIGLPKGRSVNALALAGATILAMALVTVPLAVEHKTNLPIGQKLVNYAQTQLNPAKSTLIITDEVAPLIFFLGEEAPNYRTLRMKEQDIAAQLWRLEAQGRTIYATLSPAKVTGDWVPAARLCRGQFMESRGPLEVWIYKHSPGAPSSKTSSTSPPALSQLECYNPTN